MKFFKDLDILQPAIVKWPVCRKYRTQWSFSKYACRKKPKPKDPTLFTSTSWSRKTYRIKSWKPKLVLTQNTHQVLKTELWTCVSCSQSKACCFITAERSVRSPQTVPVHCHGEEIGDQSLLHECPSTLPEWIQPSQNIQCANLDDPVNKKALLGY